MKGLVSHMQMMYRIHRWTSLVCALFLLMLILTGLPLLFRDQINGWNTVNLPENQGPMDSSAIWSKLADGEDAVKQAYPGKEILTVTPDTSDGTLYFLVKDKTAARVRAHMRMGGEQIMYDVRTGSLFNRADRAYRSDGLQNFMHTMHLFHVGLAFGTYGRTFLTVMCFLALVAVVTGLYLYAPMMKKFAFGLRRRSARRPLWSDWHKIFSMLAATWTLVLAMSGIAIDLYAGADATYHAAAMKQAAEAFPAAKDGAATVSAASALSEIEAAYPGKTVLSMMMPDSKSAFYSFQLAEPAAKPSNFMFGDFAFVPTAGNAEPLFVPAGTSLHIAPFFLNLHIHNHDQMIERIIWAVLSLLAALMTISGIWLYATRWMPKTFPGAASATTTRTLPMNKELVFFLLVPLVGFIAPIYGSWWHAVALVAFAAVLLYAARQLRK